MTDNKKLSPAWRIIAFAVTAAVVAADRLSKLAVVKSLVRVGSVKTVIPGVLDFNYTLNSGAAAGMLADHRWVFMTVSAVVIIAGCAALALGLIKSRFSAVSAAMVIGGGIGNMIDRTLHGEVVDFIAVTLKPFSNFFPFNTSFNVADVFVCVGCALLIISVLAQEIKEAKAKKKKEKDASPDGTEE